MDVSIIESINKIYTGMNIFLYLSGILRKTSNNFIEKNIPKHIEDIIKIGTINNSISCEVKKI